MRPLGLCEPAALMAMFNMALLMDPGVDAAILGLETFVHFTAERVELILQAVNCTSVGHGEFSVAVAVLSL